MRIGGGGEMADSIVIGNRTGLHRSVGDTAAWAMNGSVAAAKTLNLQSTGEGGSLPPLSIPANSAAAVNFTISCL